MDMVHCKNQALFQLTEYLVVPPISRKVLVVRICVYEVKT